MDIEDVSNMPEAATYIVEHSREIYVRERINGEWQNVALADLPVSLCVEHTARLIRRWFEDGTPPFRATKFLTDPVIGPRGRGEA